jgi:hypothetical protein
MNWVFCGIARNNRNKNNEITQNGLCGISSVFSVSNYRCTLLCDKFNSIEKPAAAVRLVRQRSDGDYEIFK